jgi:hypothetical protein
MDETFSDLGGLADEELKAMIDRLTVEETEVSYRRRILHGQIDILRAELVNRLRVRHREGGAVIGDTDVDRLTDILANRASTLRLVPDAEPSNADPARPSASPSSDSLPTGPKAAS